MTRQNTNAILKILDEEYGTTKEGFLHVHDWQLLTAIMLSAQSTDKQVDETLPFLWGKFPSLEAIADAPAEEIENAIKSICTARCAHCEKCMLEKWCEKRL